MRGNIIIGILGVIFFGFVTFFSGYQILLKLGIVERPKGMESGLVIAEGIDTPIRIDNEGFGPALIIPKLEGEGPALGIKSKEKSNE